MRLIIADVYDALRAIDVPEEKARKAAEALAGYTPQLAALERDMAVLRWMVGTNVVLTLAVLAKLLHG